MSLPGRGLLFRQVAGAGRPQVGAHAARRVGPGRHSLAGPRSAVTEARAGYCKPRPPLWRRVTRKPRTHRSKPPRRVSAGTDLQRRLGKIEAGPISLIDASGTVLHTGSGVVRLLGYRQGEREGHGIFELIHPDDLQAAKEAFA